MKIRAIRVKCFSCSVPSFVAAAGLRDTAALRGGGRGSKKSVQKKVAKVRVPGIVMAEDLDLVKDLKETVSPCTANCPHISSPTSTSNLF